MKRFVRRGGKGYLPECMTENRLPRREEISALFKWALEDIYPDGTAWEEDYVQLKEIMGTLAALEGTLQHSAEDLLKALTAYGTVMEKAEKLFVYAHMKKDEDNGESTSQALLDRAQASMVEAESTAAFIVPELLTIPKQVLDAYIEDQTGLRDYDHFIDETTRKRAHTLSAREEQILAMTGEMAAAPVNIFSMINNADMRFPNVLNENGEEIELTKGRYIQLLESSDRNVRQKAFCTLYETYGKQKNTLAATLNAGIKKDIFFARMRKYTSDREASLGADNINVSVYDNLIETVEQNLGTMHRYVSLRKKALGLETMEMFDLYVPIVKDVNMKVPYAEAQKMVAEGLKPLGEAYGRILQEGYANGWIDVCESQGKTDGAYSWGCYDTHPYVLLNYQDNIDNVFTLAHEMGHSIHSYLSNQHQPYMKAGYKIFVAEVASTLNEILLTEHLLSTLKDDQQKAYILNYSLEQFRGTVYRQTMFAAFEKTVHGMAASGQPLTCEALSRVYRELNIRYYGPEITVNPEIDLEWARIPHFYTPFYVYKYATGFCAATALAGQIMKEGPQAVERYLTFLSSGGSDYPIELLKKAGVDMSTPSPIMDALKTFDQMVNRLEQLLG